MAKVRMGILDGFKGKLGTIIGSFFKGLPVMRAYNRFPSNPKTKAQNLVRAKYAVTCGLIKAFNKALKIGLKRLSYNRMSTQQGEFARINYNVVSGSTPSALTVAYADIVISQGDLTGVGFGAADFTTPLVASVPISEANSGDEGTSNDDIVYLVAFCPDLNKSVKSDGTVTRSDNSVSVSVPASWQGLKVHLYGFVQSASDSGLVSDSTYIGFGDIS